MLYNFKTRVRCTTLRHVYAVQLKTRVRCTTLRHVYAVQLAVTFPQSLHTVQLDKSHCCVLVLNKYYWSRCARAEARRQAICVRRRHARCSSLDISP